MRLRPVPEGPSADGLARRRRADRRFGLLLALPATLAVAALVGGPALRTLLYSLQRVAVDGTTSWAGLRNFRTLVESPEFRQALLTTTIYAVSFLVVSTVLGLLFALLLNEPFRGRGVARTLLIIPWACPWVVVGIVWKWFVDAEVGALNAALVGTGAIAENEAFLADDRWALVMTVLAASWRQASFAGLLFLAALQSIPDELPAAARVDGAGVWQRFRHITLPWLRPVMIVVLVVNVIFGFMQFDVIFAMTEGGPGDATTILSILLYRQLFVLTDVGLGSAVAVVLGLVALLVGLVFVRIIYRSAALERTAT